VEELDDSAQKVDLPTELGGAKAAVTDRSDGFTMIDLDGSGEEMDPPVEVIEPPPRSWMAERNRSVCRLEEQKQKTQSPVKADLVLF
jgi:hypothetical protein